MQSENMTGEEWRAYLVRLGVEATERALGPLSKNAKDALEAALRERMAQAATAIVFGIDEARAPAAPVPAVCGPGALGSRLAAVTMRAAQLHAAGGITHREAVERASAIERKRGAL